MGTTGREGTERTGLVSIVTGLAGNHDVPSFVDIGLDATHPTSSTLPTVKENPHNKSA